MVKSLKGAIRAVLLVRKTTPNETPYRDAKISIARVPGTGKAKV